MRYEYLLIEKQNGIATLTLNRPQKHNALSQGLLAELRDALDTNHLIWTKQSVLSS